MSDNKKLIAYWSISLDVECPCCGKDVDLLDHSEFWVTHSSLKPIENHSERSRDVKVDCPECAHNFAVDLEY